jgi:uncharacterized protein (TIRG00374 family)
MNKKSFMGGLIAVGVVFLLLRQIDLNQLGSALLGVRPEILVLGLATQLAVMWIKALRWGVTMRGATGRCVRHVFRASMIGFAGNLVLPARLGELIRVDVIDKHNQIGRPLALTTIALTQLFDLLALTVYFLIVSIWATRLLAPHLWGVSVIGFVMVAMLLSMVMLRHKPQLFRAAAEPLFRRIPRAMERPLRWYLDLFVTGLGVLGQGRLLIQVALLTIALWSLETVSTHLMLMAFHIEVSLIVTAILVVVVNLSFAFPVTPGNVGITQGLTVFILGAFDIPQVAALAYSMGFQGAASLLVVGLGLVIFYQEGLSFRLLRKSTPTEVFGQSSAQG